MIYVVKGTTGEYSDRSEWPVVAYENEADAQAHVVAASRVAKEIESTREFEYHLSETEKKKNPYDPNISMDYTGTHYFIYEVELLSAFSEQPGELREAK